MFRRQDFTRQESHLVGNSLRTHGREPLPKLDFLLGSQDRSRASCELQAVFALKGGNDEHIDAAIDVRPATHHAQPGEGAAGDEGEIGGRGVSHENPVPRKVAYSNP